MYSHLACPRYSNRKIAPIVALVIIAIAWIFAPAATAGNTTGQKPATAFHAGASAIDITPLELPVIVNGGVRERLADKIHDPLHARCLVLDDGTKQLAIAVVDNCIIPRALADKAKALAAKNTPIPSERILISATHTHSAPSVYACLGTDCDEKYAKWLPAKIA